MPDTQSNEALTKCALTESTFNNKLLAVNDLTIKLIKIPSCQFHRRNPLKQVVEPCQMANPTLRCIEFQS